MLGGMFRLLNVLPCNALIARNRHSFDCRTSRSTPYLFVRGWSHRLTRPIPTFQLEEMVQRQARRSQDRDRPVREHDPQRGSSAQEGGEAGSRDLARRQVVVEFGTSGERVESGLDWMGRMGRQADPLDRGRSRKTTGPS